MEWTNTLALAFLAMRERTAPLVSCFVLFVSNRVHRSKNAFLQKFFGRNSLAKFLFSNVIHPSTFNNQTWHKTGEYIFSSWFFSDTDECYPNPCVNNGTCIDQVNNYTCACAVGFEGRNCTDSKWFWFPVIWKTMLFKSFENTKFCFKLRKRRIKSVYGPGIASITFFSRNHRWNVKKKEDRIWFFLNIRSKLNWSTRFLEFFPLGFNFRKIKVCGSVAL